MRLNRFKSNRNSSAFGHCSWFVYFHCVPAEDIVPRWYAKLCPQIKKTTGQSNRFSPFIASTYFQVTKPKPRFSLSKQQAVFPFLVSFRVHLKPSFIFGYCFLEQLNHKYKNSTPLGFWQKVCFVFLHRCCLYSSVFSTGKKAHLPLSQRWWPYLLNPQEIMLTEPELQFTLGN